MRTRCERPLRDRGWIFVLIWPTEWVILSNTDQLWCLGAGSMSPPGGRTEPLQAEQLIIALIQNVSALIRGEDLTCTCTCTYRGGSQVRGQRSWSWQGAPPQMCWLILMINNLLLSYSQKKNSEKCKRSDRKPNNLKFKHEMKPLFKTQTEVTRAPLKTSFI